MKFDAMRPAAGAGSSPASWRRTALTARARPVRRASCLAGGVLLVLLSGLSMVGAAHAQQRMVALVVGNAKYATAGKLANAENDARDMCDVLLRLRFETECKFNVTTKREFKDAILRFRDKVVPGAVAVFYYAGHGVQVRGENFLIPTDTPIRSEADVADEALSLTYFLDEMEAARAKGEFTSIVLLDACRDNPFARLTRSASSGLAQVNAPDGTFVSFSTAPGRTALDGRGRNGLYTRHLLANIAQPGLSVEELFKRVRSGVNEESRALGHPQTPWDSSSLTGNFCFAGCATPQVVRHEAEIRRLLDQLAQAEARRQEAEAMAKAAAERELSALKERAREQERAVADAQGRAKDSASKELDTLRRRLAELEQQGKVEQARAEEQSRREIAALQAQRRQLEEQLRQAQSAASVQPAASAPMASRSSEPKPAEPRRAVPPNIPSF